MTRRVSNLRLIQASLFVACFGVAPVTALAEDPPFADLPAALMERLERGGTLEEYLKRLAQEAERGDLDGNGLDRQDIEIAEQMQAAQYRALMLQHLVMSDLDGNGEVTRDEATRAATYQLRTQGGGESDGSADALKKQTAKLVDRVMVLDSDGNGVVTIAEGMQAAPPEERRQREFVRYEALLELDPDKDGRLTPEELDQVARQAFAAVDYDHDGTLSSSELKLLAPARELQRQLKAAMPCDLPQPGAGEVVTVLGIYDGVLQPNVTVSGQDETTQLTLIDIEPGDRPLYLVLTSYISMIWQFTGATERLARVAVVGADTAARHPELAGAGVIGVEADKVTFLPPNSCGGSYNKLASKEAKVMARVVQNVTGRAPDSMLGIYSAKIIAVPSGAFQKQGGDKDLIIPGDGDDVVILGNNSNAKVVRGGGLPLIEHEDWLANAGNLTIIDPDRVLAPGKVETYEILPHQYGLRQLVQEGKLERTGEGYRIVEPIARFPTGLSGAHGVVFILPEGMPMPGGDAGHSGIVLEKKN